jgi:hypothetical protein
VPLLSNCAARERLLFPSVQDCLFPVAIAARPTLESFLLVLCIQIVAVVLL